ncbi:hypothetical protein ACTWQL_04800 [Pseudalkalibacillus sp. R45]
MKNKIILLVAVALMVWTFGIGDAATIASERGVVSDSVESGS